MKEVKEVLKIIQDEKNNSLKTFILISDTTNLKLSMKKQILKNYEHLELLKSPSQSICIAFGFLDLIIKTLEKVEQMLENKLKQKEYAEL